MFQCLGWMRKNFIPGNFSWSIAAETWDASCFKKGLLEKQQSVPNTCAILPLKKILYQNFIKTFLKFSTLTPPSKRGRDACPESSIKTKSLNTKQCPTGLSPRIICQVSPFLPKMSQNCCTHQVWTVPLSSEPLWLTLRMGKNPTQQPKICSFPL